MSSIGLLLRTAVAGVYSKGYAATIGKNSIRQSQFQFLEDMAGLLVTVMKEADLVYGVDDASFVII